VSTSPSRATLRPVVPPAAACRGFGAHARVPSRAMQGERGREHRSCLPAAVRAGSGQRCAGLRGARRWGRTRAPQPSGLSLKAGPACSAARQEAAERAGRGAGAPAAMAARLCFSGALAVTAPASRSRRAAASAAPASGLVLGGVRLRRDGLIGGRPLGSSKEFGRLPITLRLFHVHARPLLPVHLAVAAARERKPWLRLSPLAAFSRSHCLGLGVK